MGRVFVTTHYQTVAGKETRGRETNKDTATMAEKEAWDGRGDGRGRDRTKVLGRAGK